MNLTLRRFQISRVGTHTSSTGSKYHFSEEMLRNCANEFNQRASKGESRAPLFIGHPSQTGKRDPLGFVKQLDFEHGKLYATAYITDQLRDLVRGKVYKAVSAGFHALGNSLKLDHIAFLNNPAVKGMEALNFSEQGNLIMFSESLTTDFSEDPYALHAAALDYQAKHKCGYEQAVHACLREKQYAEFAEAAAQDGNESIMASHVLHQQILERQAKFGGTYEENYAAISQQRARGL